MGLFNTSDLGEDHWSISLPKVEMGKTHFISSCAWVVSNSHWQGCFTGNMAYIPHRESCNDIYSSVSSPNSSFTEIPSLYMSGNKMDGRFSWTRLSTFELLHGENYFSDKKNKMGWGNTGCFKGSPQYLINIAYEYNLEWWQRKKDASVSEKQETNG